MSWQVRHAGKQIFPTASPRLTECTPDSRCRGQIRGARATRGIRRHEDGRWKHLRMAPSGRPHPARRAYVRLAFRLRARHDVSPRGEGARPRFHSRRRGRASPRATPSTPRRSVSASSPRSASAISTKRCTRSATRRWSASSRRRGRDRGDRGERSASRPASPSPLGRLGTYPRDASTKITRTASTVTRRPPPSTSKCSLGSRTPCFTATSRRWRSATT